MKATLDIRWAKIVGKYQYGWNCTVGDGIPVGHVYEPTQSKDYNGPRWRPETSLPGIRIKQGLLTQTEDEAKAVVERTVRAWFQRCGVVEEWPDKKHPSHVTRVSVDASSYDEICVNCGATDIAGGGWGDLRKPCAKPASPPPAEDAARPV